MNTEAILNSIWALLCIAGLSFHFWRERGRMRRAAASGRALLLQRAVSVLLAAVALFPVISASDDRLRLADICTASVPQNQAFDGRHESNVVPSPSLEDPEHGQTSEPLAVLWLPLVSVLPPRVEKSPLAAWIARRSLGRAPPVRPARVVGGGM